MIPERYASYEKTVTVGVVNFTSVPGDTAANLEKIEANLREAAAQGVQIVAFPEEALVATGRRRATGRAASRRERETPRTEAREERAVDDATVTAEDMCTVRPR